MRKNDDISELEEQLTTVILLDDYREEKNQVNVLEEVDCIEE